MAISDLTCQMGFSEQKFYRWKKQYAGLQSDQVRDLKQLQDENTWLKKLVAELSLDKAVLQDINSKNGPARAEASGDELRDRSLTVESAMGRLWVPGSTRRGHRRHDGCNTKTDV